ncbi:hypothetical protein GCM10017600_25890 [Streptosporangium carneum]|uniref:DUF4158 domain-containing protein n=1 Tax=Streptosporangium carneum TaxID=47481 RepID=A0A9W6HZZ7_9ACTN|nr:hypothetical protein GCM10017600_25890 [Streptosporangium carneum]
MANKAGATRLGFSLLPKFFELEARFPRHAGELPKAAVDYVAGQVKVEPPGLIERIVRGSRARFEDSVAAIRTDTAEATDERLRCAEDADDRPVRSVPVFDILCCRCSEAGFR